MATMSKTCTICSAVFEVNNYTKYRQTCSRKCADELRKSKLPAEMLNGTRPKLHPKTKARQLERERQLRAEAAPYRAKVIRDWNEDTINTKCPKYREQLAIDKAWRDSIACPTSPVRTLTQAEIDAIRHTITPIERVRSTQRDVLMFAEPDPTYERRRFEDVGSLFGRV